MKLHITIAAINSTEHRDMIALRHCVLREPLGLAFSEADLAAETGQLHLALLRDDIVIGTVLLVPPNGHGTARLRQMAIAPTCNGQGFGALLLRRAELEFARLKTAKIILAARQDAVGFYERFGYRVEGHPFDQLTIQHLSMRKHLQ